MLIESKEFRTKQKKYIIKVIDDITEDCKIPSFTEWAEQHRYLPEGSSVSYGRFTRETAPHMIEILERLHPDDPCTHVSVMKSVQAGVTTTVLENALGAFIQYRIASILSLTASKNLARIRSSSAIDVLIDNAGLSDKVKPMSTRMKRKTADNTYYKEFAGGIKLLMSSYNSIADMKSVTYGLILKDEIDEMPVELKGQGDTNQIIEGRTLGLRHYKILNVSTPSRLETSQIYKNFLEGDQRYYFVPCPLCEKKQILRLKGGKYDYGLTFSMEKDKSGRKVLKPETIRYECKFCHGEFGESKKQWMLKNGEWRPTAKQVNRKKLSYHISGLYSPETFLSWERICQAFIDTDFGKDILKFKDFVINIIGEPWSHIEKTASWVEFKESAEDYRLGEVPEGALILTGGVDVQKDRLELHVVGFGKGMEKWTVDYQVFHGNPANIDDTCWTALHQTIYEKTYKILGKECFISKCAIDSGYDPKQDFGGKSNVIYDFVGMRTDRFMAVMGLDVSKQVSLLQGVRVNDSTLTKRYNITSSVFKDMIFSSVNIEPGPRCIHVPKYRHDGIEIEDHWYRQFMSERYQEISPGKYGWKLIYRRNEVLDTFVYAMAAAEAQNLSSYSHEMWDMYSKQIIDYVETD